MFIKLLHNNGSYAIIMNMENIDIKEICQLDEEIYSCISEKIDTNKVVITNKQFEHIVEKHPDAYDKVLIKLQNTILDPDYIIRDEKHADTGFVIRKIDSDATDELNNFIILKVCTDSNGGLLANSVISGWIISKKRLANYLRNKQILYKR